MFSEYSNATNNIYIEANTAPVAPAAPSNLQVGSYIDTGTQFLIPISWQDNSSNETGFKCYWNTTGIYNLFTTVGAGLQTANFNLSIMGYTYQRVKDYGFDAYLRFRVGAYNARGENTVTDTSSHHIVIPPKP